jgi:hypothetical protein
MKKQPSNTKKKSTTAKKAPHSVRNATHNTKKKSSIARKKPPVVKKAAHNAQNEHTHGTSEQRIDLLPAAFMEDTIEGITSIMNDFEDVAGNNLTAVQRRRKIGAGIKNYGFIEKVTDLAEANPQFAQFFRVADLRNAVRNIDMCRDLVLLLQSFVRLASNTMLIYSDEAFTMALIFYNMVREMSRRGDPAAMELFRTLQPFFRRPRRSSAEPTEKELERDLHALIHGKKDGKIVIENVKPKLAGGVRKVVDERFSDSEQFKETEEVQKS